MINGLTRPEEVAAAEFHKAGLGPDAAIEAGRELLRKLGLWSPTSSADMSDPCHLAAALKIAVELHLGTINHKETVTLRNILEAGQVVAAVQRMNDNPARNIVAKAERAYSHDDAPVRIDVSGPPSDVLKFRKNLATVVHEVMAAGHGKANVDAVLTKIGQGD